MASGNDVFCAKADKDLLTLSGLLPATASLKPLPLLMYLSIKYSAKSEPECPVTPNTTMSYLRDSQGMISVANPDSVPSLPTSFSSSKQF